jgi:hypothetical protein
MGAYVDGLFYDNIVLTAGDLQAAQADAITAARLVTPNISGAVARTLASRFTDAMSILDFGVFGDGTTDDTTAYQNALNECAGKCALLHPAGLNVRTFGTLSIPAMTHLMLYGTITALPSTGTLRTVLNIVGSNVFITGGNTGKIDGNKAGQTGTGSASAGIGCAGSYSDIHITDLEITNIVNWPVNLTVGVTNCIIERCLMHDSGNSAEVNAASNCHFRFNTVYNITDQGISLYAGDTNCSVVGNTVYSCWDGIGIYSDTPQPAGDSYCLMAENIVYGIRDFGLFVSGVSGSGGQENWCQVVNNIMYGNGTGGTAGTGSINIKQSSGVRVAGNTIHGDLGTQPYSIWINGPLANIIVENNYLTDCGVAGGVGAYAICGTSGGGTPTNIIIRDNVVNDTRGSGRATAYAIYCDSLFLNAGCVVKDNIALGTFISTAPFNVPPVVASVVIQGCMTANNSGNSYSFSETLLVPGVQASAGGSLDGSIVGADTLLVLGKQSSASTPLIKAYSSGGGSAFPDVTFTFTSGTAGTANQGTLTIQAANLVISNTVIEQGVINFTQLASTPLVATASYANDAAAAASGLVPIGGVYRNGSVMQIRVT